MKHIKALWNTLPRPVQISVAAIIVVWAAVKAVNTFI